MGFRSHQRVNQQETENHSEVSEWLLDISLRDVLAYRRADLCLKSKLEKVELFLLNLLAENTGDCPTTPDADQFIKSNLHYCVH